MSNYIFQLNRQTDFELTLELEILNFEITMCVVNRY